MDPRPPVVPPDHELEDSIRDNLRLAARQHITIRLMWFEAQTLLAMLERR